MAVLKKIFRFIFHLFVWFIIERIVEKKPGYMKICFWIYINIYTLILWSSCVASNKINFFYFICFFM